MLTKKYTMQEFKEMFRQAIPKAMDKVSEKLEDKDKDPMFGFITLSVATIGMSAIEEVLFGDKDEEEK